MIDKIDAADKPEKIKICQGTAYANDSTGTAFTIPSVVGVQLYYGTGANELAGPAHGDMSQGCTEYQFPSRPTGVALYTAGAGQPLIGIKITFASSSISGGPVDIVNMFKAEKVYAATDLTQFFGFQTQFDDATSAFTDGNIISYDTVEFARVKNVIKNTAAAVAATNVNIQAAIDGQVEWTQIAIYQKVIEADVLTGISKVVPGPVYVLRQSEADQIQKDIDAQVVAIKAEQAAYNLAYTKAKEEGLGSDDPAVKDHEGNDEPENAGAIIALVFGLFLLIAVILVMVFKCRMQKKMTEMNKAGGRKT